MNGTRPTNRSKPKAPAIQGRAETRRAETGLGSARTPAGGQGGAGGAGAIPAGGPGAAGETPAELHTRLWGLCSPLPPGGYEPPWRGIAADLSDRLAAILATTRVCASVAAAARLEYVGCVKALLRAAPAVHRVLTDVRGLALAAVPELVTTKRDIAREVAPGVPLVYDVLAP